MSRRASDTAGSVLSFTFLDVLMCTMGSLLLLLCVFGVIVKKSTRARRAGEETKISLAALSAPSAPAPTPVAVAGAATVEDAAELAHRLDEVRRAQADTERRRREAAEARRQEQERITHLEDHERRLEHDLGKLHVTLQALEAAEQKQTIDQVQAAAEAARLNELIRETEARLAEMRQQDSPDKSYAIVPYKGANGTFRRPVFVECTAEAVTIQPEGIVLTVADFDGPLRSGNPLAAAIRAAHQELNSRAVAAGQADMPDPYPLLIVRPDGAAAYAVALDAISSWESDYGYEFVEADWKLKYSEPDPRLAQVMTHAVDQARQRQALLAKLAPRRYGARLSSGRGGLGGVGDVSAGGDGFNDLAGGADDRIGAHAGEGALAGDGTDGNPLRGGSTAGSGGGGRGGNFSDEFAAVDGIVGGAATTGGGAGIGPGGGGAGGGGPGVPGPSGAAGQAANGATVATASRYSLQNAQDGTNGAQGVAPGTQSAAKGSPNAPTGAQSTGAEATDAIGAQTAAAGSSTANGNAPNRSSSAGGSASSTASSSGSGGAAGGNGGSGNAAGSSITVGSPGIQPIQMNARRSSAADTRGANWPNAEASRRASPITRPIKVQVNSDQLAVLNGDTGASADAAIVSFQQPVNRVMDQLAAAIQRQIADWGLAGDGMYWRPTLVVNVAPGAEPQAARLAELLDNSGLDVRLPQSVARTAEGAGHETR